MQGWNAVRVSWFKPMPVAGEEKHRTSGCRESQSQQLLSKMPDAMKNSLFCITFCTFLIAAAQAPDNSSVFGLHLGSPQKEIVNDLASKYVLTPPEGTNIWIARPRSGSDGIYKWHELAFDNNQRLFAVTSHGADHSATDTATLSNDLFNELYWAAKPPKAPGKLASFMNAKFIDTRISLYRYPLGQIGLEEIVIPLENDTTLSLKIEKEIGKATAVHIEYQRAREQ